MITIGGKEWISSADEIYYGNRKIQEVYYGNKKVYPDSQGYKPEADDYIIKFIGYTNVNYLNFSGNQQYIFENNLFRWIGEPSYMTTNIKYSVVFNFGKKLYHDMTNYISNDGTIPEINCSFKNWNWDYRYKLIWPNAYEFEYDDNIMMNIYKRSFAIPTYGSPEILSDRLELNNTKINYCEILLDVNITPPSLRSIFHAKPVLLPYHQHSILYKTSLYEPHQDKFDMLANNINGEHFITSKEVVSMIGGDYWYEPIKFSINGNNYGLRFLSLDKSYYKGFGNHIGATNFLQLTCLYPYSFINNAPDDNIHFNITDYEGSLDDNNFKSLDEIPENVKNINYGRTYSYQKIDMGGSAWVSLAEYETAIANVPIKALIYEGFVKNAKQIDLHPNKHDFDDIIY